MTSIWLNYINSFWLFRKCIKSCFCMRKHRYLKNDYQFFDALKTKDRKIRGNCNLLTKVKFHKLEWRSPLIMYTTGRSIYRIYTIKWCPWYVAPLKRIWNKCHSWKSTARNAISTMVLESFFFVTCKRCFIFLYKYIFLSPKNQYFSWKQVNNKKHFVRICYLKS